MKTRSFLCFLALAAFAAAQTPAAKSKNWTVPALRTENPIFKGVDQRDHHPDGAAREPDGQSHPDRRRGQGLRKVESGRAGQAGRAVGRPADRGGRLLGVGGYNVLFVDRGTELARVDGVKRTSLVIDPPDGKVPPITPEARQRNASMMRAFFNYDSVKTRPTSERCLIGFGSTSGPR